MTLGSIFLLVLISMALGFLIGALVYGLRTGPAGVPPAQASEPASPEESVRLWRDSQTQNLAVELDGRTYQQAGELTPEARGRLARLAGDWQLWLGMPSSRLTAPAGSSGQAGEAPEPKGTGQVDAPAAGGVAAGGATNAAPAAAGMQAARAGPSRSPHGTPAPQSVAGQSIAGQSIAGQSVAAQIDEILQARLQNTPLAERGINLQEIAGRGLVVEVGQEQYTDLTQVPDEQVRAAVAEAFAEWEKKNAPWS